MAAVRPGQPPRRPPRKALPGLHFQGVVGFLESNFEESESDTYREWITQYMSPVPCAVCGEQRLRPESLAVKVGGRSIAEFTGAGDFRRASRRG